MKGEWNMKLTIAYIRKSFFGSGVEFTEDKKYYPTIDDLNKCIKFVDANYDASFHLEMDDGIIYTYTYDLFSEWEKKTVVSVITANNWNDKDVEKMPVRQARKFFRNLIK